VPLNIASLGAELSISSWRIRFLRRRNTIKRIAQQKRTSAGMTMAAIRAPVEMLDFLAVLGILVPVEEEEDAGWEEVVVED
jgi:hypothetical protein